MRDAQAVPLVDLDAAKDGAVRLCPLLGDAGAEREAGDDALAGGRGVDGRVDHLGLFLPATSGATQGQLVQLGRAREARRPHHSKGTSMMCS